MGTVILHQLAGSKKALDACRLVDGLYLAGRRVVVWLSDRGRAAMFDEYLWTFAQHSFVPHVLWNGGDDVDDPVVIVTGNLARPNGGDVLVVVDGLADPAEASGFVEVHDFVTRAADDAARTEAWRSSSFNVKEVRGVAAPREAGQ